MLAEGPAIVRQLLPLLDQPVLLSVSKVTLLQSQRTQTESRLIGQSSVQPN